MNILVYSRNCYGSLFTQVESEKFTCYHFVTNIEEKKLIEKLGGVVVGCWEEEFDDLEEADIPPDILQSSFFGDRFLGWLTISERRSILGKLITFYRNIFSKKKYVACVHETISFEPEEVLSLIAKEFKCKDLTFISSAFDDYFYWKPIPYSTSIPKEVFESIQVNNELTSFVQQFLTKTKAKGHKPKFLEYVAGTAYPKVRKLTLIKELFKYELKRKFGSLTYKERAINKKISLFHYDNMYANIKCDEEYYESWLDKWYINFGRYDSLDNHPDVKILFFPLHYEPEATLLYFHPKYAIQKDVIQNIASNLPHDYILVVKEHPLQPGYLLRKEYSDLRRRNSNLIFLPGEFDSYTILKQCESVITIVGSVGLEALINNIPVIVLGNVFYDSHPDVMKIEDYTELKEILGNHKLRIPNDENTFEFLLKFISFCHLGNVSNPKLFEDKENIKNVATAIEKALLS